MTGYDEQERLQKARVESEERNKVEEAEMMPMPRTLLQEDSTNSDFHLVTIKKVDNGWIIKIGCATFVSRSWEEVNKELGLYWNDPNAAKRKYRK